MSVEEGVTSYGGGFKGKKGKEKKRRNALEGRQGRAISGGEEVTKFVGRKMMLLVILGRLARNYRRRKINV